MILLAEMNPEVAKRTLDSQAGSFSGHPQSHTHVKAEVTGAAGVLVL